MAGILQSRFWVPQSAIAYKNNWATIGTANPTLTASSGDFLIASIVNLVAAAGNDAITPPSGWTTIASRTWNASGAYKGRHSIYQKTATGSEGTQTWSGVSPLLQNAMVASWTGVDTAVGIEATANTGVPGDGVTPIATSQNFSSATSLTNNAMIVAIAYAAESGGSSPGGVWPATGPSGYTQEIGQSPYVALGYKTQAVAGATGSLAVTLDSDVVAWTAWTLAMKAL